MKRISLTQGQYAIVDDDDFEKFGKFKWCARWKESSKSFYAVRRRPGGGCMYLARAIMSEPKGMLVDHRNHNTLDCRKENLRVCTKAENGMNRKGPQINSTSGIRGAYWFSPANRWKASIKVKGINIHLGYFADKGDAAAAYAVANRKYFGEFGGHI